MRTVENSILLGDVLCVLRDMGITKEFIIYGKTFTTKLGTAEEHLNELMGTPELECELTATDNINGKIYITVE